MEVVAPAGPMYQAGTLSGNPLAMTAGSFSPYPPFLSLSSNALAMSAGPPLPHPPLHGSLAIPSPPCLPHRLVYLTGAPCNAHQWSRPTGCQGGVFY